MRSESASWLVIACLMSIGCKSKAPDGDKPASETTTATQPAATASVAAPAATAATPASAGGCPAGRWSYDYSDQALEILMKNVAGAKVVKKEGTFVCTVSEGTQGTVVCETQGKPVVNVVETNQAGMKMVISITIDGKATTRFELTDGQRMKVLSSDTSQLKLDTKVTMAGKDMPFPTNKLMTLFGEPQSELAYKCEEGKLLLKPEVKNVDTPWQRLEPVK